MTEPLLLDTNILIDHLRGKPAANDFLQANIINGTKMLVSVITRIELMCGMKPGEDERIRAFLSIFEEIMIDKDIAEIAGRYMNRYYKSNGLNTADAIIAASAKSRNAVLYTLNVRHFPLDDIHVIIPY
ncbi:MAG: type II toxin-antitoxin system VapC family toxin [Clostridiaceae bacterium]|jgi:predicted nucleic acid-binding protein|nr:type II toxin-antitoxin system VapC family toxin [Clostridiaceae bacterium]